MNIYVPIFLVPNVFFSQEKLTSQIMVRGNLGIVKCD